MAELFGADFFRQLARLRLRSGAVSEASLAGLRKSHAKGSSVEFSDFREYLPGDDIRRLDWNAYARFGKLYIKLFREEKEGIFTIYVDLSRSMNYGACPKAVQALRIAAVFCRMVLENQDRARLCLCGLPHDKKFPALCTFHGSAAFPRVLAWLQQAEDLRVRSLDGEEYAEEESLWESVRRYAPAMGGTSILLSDFLPPGKGEANVELADAVRFLRGYRKQSVFLMQILSQEERQPEFSGTNRLLDMESGGEVRVTLTPGLIRAYGKALQAFLWGVEETASKNGCVYQLIASEEAVASFLYKGMNVSWERL